MAKRSTSNVGGVFGVILGLILVGGLVASPFYLDRLQADLRSLDASVQADVAAIRRVVLNLDANLSTLADVYDALGEEGRLDDEALDALVKAHPDLLDGVLDELKPSEDALRDVQANDEERGTVIAAPGAAGMQTGRPNLQVVLRAIHGKYATANEDLLRKAEAPVMKLARHRSGTALAGGQLSVAHVRAILSMAAGKLHRNEARFHNAMASGVARETKRRLSHQAALKRNADAVAGRDPSVLIENVEDRMSEVDARLQQLGGAAAQLRETIQAKEARLAEVQEAAAEAHARLTEMDSEAERAGGRMTPRAFERYRAEYETLADDAREAEAEAAALMNGTLAGATLQESAEPSELLLAKYEGGRPEIGIRDLSVGLDILEEQRTTLERIRGDLDHRLASLNETRDGLEERGRQLEEAVRAETRVIEQLRTEANAHVEAAQAAADKAVDAFKKAAQSAEKALRAAGERAQRFEAGGASESLLQRIKNDKDTQAAMQCLVAEISYDIALTYQERISAAIVRGGDGDLEQLQSEALNALAKASTAYEKAANLIKGSSLRTGGRTLSGKDYVWQVQVGLAAVYMLRASLTDDADEADEQLTQAYSLLSEAAEGREQSPLLSPAVDTLLYLQHRGG